jgi:hypothetical protein
MSKGPSGNTTQTVQNNNPAANAQLPFLQNLWQSASNLSGQPSPYIGSLQSYFGNQGDITAGPAAPIMPTALQQYMQQLGYGIPSSSQAAGLTGNAAAAVNNGTAVGGNIISQAPGYANLLQNTGTGALSGLSGISNLQTGLAPGALAQLQALSGQAQGVANPAISGLYGTAGSAIGGNPAYSSGLMGLASGQYINPSTNPALAGTLSAALTPITNQFMTSTAPLISSGMENAGRYGSGAMANITQQAGYGLGQALQNAASGIVNNAYNTGLSTTLGAGSALGQLYNTGIANQGNLYSNAGNLAQSGVNNAANIVNAGYGTTGNLLAGGGATLQNAYGTAGGLYGNAANTNLGYLTGGGNLINQGYNTADTALGAGGQLMNTGDIALTNALSNAPTFAGYPGSAYTSAYNAPYLPLSDLSSLLGGAIGGTGTQTTTTPYYSNTGANILSGLTGGATLLNTIGGAFLSDRRIKRDIAPIGRLRNGLMVYRFRYIADHRMQVGLMADEVERVRPEAVLTLGVLELKAVDYARAMQ